MNGPYYKIQILVVRSKVIAYWKTQWRLAQERTLVATPDGHWTQNLNAIILENKERYYLW
jgi:hypothetical protein